MKRWTRTLQAFLSLWSDKTTFLVARLFLWLMPIDYAWYMIHDKHVNNRRLQSHSICERWGSFMKAVEFTWITSLLKTYFFFFLRTQSRRRQRRSFLEQRSASGHCSGPAPYRPDPSRTAQQRRGLNRYWNNPWIQMFGSLFHLFRIIQAQEKRDEHKL